jgi:hypothetical protein
MTTGNSNFEVARYAAFCLEQAASLEPTDAKPERYEDGKGRIYPQSPREEGISGHVRAHAREGNSPPVRAREGQTPNVALTRNRMKPEVINVKASELLKNGKVAARVAELRAAHAARHDITVDDLVDELQEARALAIKRENPSAAVAATMGKAKLLGLVVDKGELTGKDGKPLVQPEANPRDVARAIVDILREAGHASEPSDDEPEPQDIECMNEDHPSSAGGPLAGSVMPPGAATSGVVGPGVAASYPNGGSALRGPPAGDQGDPSAGAAVRDVGPAAAPSPPTEGRPLVLKNGSTIAFDGLLRKFAILTPNGDLCGYRAQFERAIELANNIK